MGLDMVGILSLAVPACVWSWILSAMFERVLDSMCDDLAVIDENLDGVLLVAIVVDRIRTEEGLLRGNYI